jgi:hypothetical protein
MQYMIQPKEEVEFFTTVIAIRSDDPELNSINVFAAFRHHVCTPPTMASLRPQEGIHLIETRNDKRPDCISPDSVFDDRLSPIPCTLAHPECRDDDEKYDGEERRCHSEVTPTRNMIE